MTTATQLSPERGDVKQQPACWGVDPELFFGPADSSARQTVFDWEQHALSVCAACPVQAACLAAALEFPADEQHGVIGGMTAGQRRALLVASRRDAHPAADEVAVARLVAGWSTTNASRQELAAAAVELHRSGLGARRIGHRLGVHARQVQRWLAAAHRAEGVA